MRILFVNAVGFIGGAERQLLQMMAAIRRDDPGAEVLLIALGDGALVGEGRAAGWRVKAICLPEEIAGLGDSSLREGGKIVRLLRMAGKTVGAIPDLFSSLSEMRGAVCAFRPDVVHVHGIKAQLMGALSFPERVPIVWHVHDFLGMRLLAGRVFRFLRRGISAAVAVSEAVKRDAGPILSGVPIHVIPNTVDVDRFTPGPGMGKRLDALAGMEAAPAGTIRVGIVSTFARWKGHDIFLEAARRICSKGRRGIRFYVVGGAIYDTGNQFALSELRSIAAAGGIEREVAFVPFQKDVAEIFRALDIVVHASTLPEPFGLSIVEAMACARAVIVANAGGASEVFTERHDALGTPPGDAAALADAIELLADDAALRARLGQNARVTVEQKFNSRRLGAELLRLYRGLAR